MSEKSLVLSRATETSLRRKVQAGNEKSKTGAKERSTLTINIVWYTNSNLNLVCSNKLWFGNLCCQFVQEMFYLPAQTQPHIVCEFQMITGPVKETKLDFELTSPKLLVHPFHKATSVWQEAKHDSIETRDLKHYRVDCNSLLRRWLPIMWLYMELMNKCVFVKVRRTENKKSHRYKHQ